MASESYLGNGRALRRLRKRRGWTQRQLVAATRACREDVALSTVKVIETGRRCVKRVTLERLAHTLGVEVERILGCKADWLRRLAGWQLVGGADTVYPWEVARALVHDMHGRHRLGADQLVRLIDELDPDDPDGFRDRAALTFCLARVLSNGGRVQRALDLLDGVLGGRGVGCRRHSMLILWGQYLRGICLRRLGRYSEARATLQELVADELHGAAALHQLGVLTYLQALSCARAYLLRGAGGVQKGVQGTFWDTSWGSSWGEGEAWDGDSAERLARDGGFGVGGAAADRDGASQAAESSPDEYQKLFGSAEASFMTSLRALEERGDAGSFRQGYSWRRLGQLYNTTGRLQEAYDCFVRACRIFDASGCTRYSAATRLDLQQFTGRQGMVDN
jgi:transcriptional regulator with XRE-family HTH domain